MISKYKKKYLIILSILAFLYALFLVSIPVFTKFLLDTAVDISTGVSDDYQTLWLFIALVSSAMLIVIVISNLDKFLTKRYVLLRENEIAKNLYDTILAKDYGRIHEYHSAKLLELFTADTTNIINREIDVIPEIIRQSTRLALAIGVLIYLDWKFLILLIIAGIFCGILSKVYSKYIKPINHNLLATEANRNSYVIDSVNQLKLIKAYNANSTSLNHFDTINQEYIAAKRKKLRVWVLANNFLTIVTNVIYIGAICYGAYGITKKWFGYGTLLAFVQLLSSVQSPLLLIAPIMNQIHLGKASKERIAKITNLENDDNQNPLNDFDEIKFNNVSFKYDDDNEIINNLTFTITKNDVLRLKGPSGIGKTTIFMLLLGFIKPVEGSITILKDNKEYEVNANSRFLFSYVPQENILFSASILDNIKILTNETDENIINALKQVNLYDELMKLPEGLNTILSERGSGISVGQIQRILICIAILSNRQILLLDEFSSAIDKTNEEAIINNLKSLNKTIIYISHKNNDIIDSKILDLEKN